MHKDPMHPRNYWLQTKANTPLFEGCNPSFFRAPVTFEVSGLVMELASCMHDAVVNLTGAYRPVVALSGGLDSATALHLSVHAYQLHEEKSEKDCILVIMFTDEFVSPEELEYARLVTKELQQQHPELPLEVIETPLPLSEVQKYYASLESKLQNKNTTGNPSLLATLTIEMFIEALSERENFATVGSTNKTEFWLGEINPNQPSAIELFEEIPKSLLYHLARELGVPTEVILREAHDSCLQVAKRNNYFASQPRGASDEDVYYTIDSICYLLELGESVSSVAATLKQDELFVQRLFDLNAAGEQRLKASLVRMYTEEVAKNVPWSWVSSGSLKPTLESYYKI